MANEILPVSESKLKSPITQLNGFDRTDFYIEVVEGGSVYDYGSSITIVLPDFSSFTFTATTPSIGLGNYVPFRYYMTNSSTGAHFAIFDNNQDGSFDEATSVSAVGVFRSGDPQRSIGWSEVPLDGTWAIYFQTNGGLPAFTLKIKAGPLYFEKDFSDLAGIGALSDYVTIWNAHTTPVLVEPQSNQNITSIPVGDTRHYSDAQQDANAATAPRSIRPPLLLPKQPSRSVVGGAMAQEYAKVPDSGYYVEFYNAEFTASGTTITFIAPNGDSISCVRTGTATVVDLRDQRFLLDGTFVQQRSPKEWTCTSTITTDTPIDGTWQIIILTVGLYFPNGQTPPTINLGNYGRYTLNNVNYLKPNSLYHIWNAHEGSYDETADLTATDVTRMATGPAQVNAANFRFYDSYGATAAELPNVMDLIASITAPDAPEAPTAPDAPSTDRPPVLVFDPDYSETVKSGIFSKGAA